MAALSTCVLLAAVLVGCNPADPSKHGSQKTAAPDANTPRDINVVIFLIDTLRADYLHTYGYALETSPHMDALAANGVLFENANAPAPWTLPTVTSLKLSMFACEHNVLVGKQRINANADPVAARLKRAGYATASHLCNAYAGPMTGLNKGYDTCKLQREQTDGDTIAPWLDQLGGRPFFLYIHNTEPHDPYLAQDKYVRQFGPVTVDERNRVHRLSDVYRQLTRVDNSRKQPLGTTDNTDRQQEIVRRLDAMREVVEYMYCGSVLECDARVGSVIAALKQRDLWDNTLFIVLADHGEEMGERGMWQHDQSVYEELIHVPLIMHFPGGEFAGTRIAEPVSLVDVVPTIMDYSNHPELADNLRGDSLLPLIRGDDDARVDLLKVTSMRHNIKKYYKPNKQQRGDIQIVVREGVWKGILNVEPDTFELYNLAEDPLERLDLSVQEAERTTRMQTFARTWYTDCQSRAMKPTTGDTLSPEAIERLKSLGYLGDDAEG